MPSPESERNLCLFRQMEKGDTEHPPADLERAFDSPEEFACKVGGCAIRGQHLLDYISAARNRSPEKLLTLSSLHRA